MSKMKNVKRFLSMAVVFSLVGVPVSQVSAKSDGVKFTVSGDCWNKNEGFIDLRQAVTKRCKISYVISSKLKVRSVELQYFYVEYPDLGWEIDLEGKSNKAGKGSFDLIEWFEFDPECYDESFPFYFRIVVAATGKNKAIMSEEIPAYYLGNTDYC